jgi:hypothetical protein
MNVPSFKETRLWVVIQAIYELAQGRNNATGSFTCSLSAASTVVTNDVVTENDVVLLMPMSAVAAAEIGNGTAYVSSLQKGQFTVSHANSAVASRSFRYVVFGG